VDHPEVPGGHSDEVDSRRGHCSSIIPPTPLGDVSTWREALPNQLADPPPGHVERFDLHGPGELGRHVELQPNPHPALAGYSERFRAREERLSAQLASGFKEHLATEGEIGLWPGCDAIDKGTADIAAAMALFERTGLDVKIIEAPQACAGYPLLAAGHRDLFRWHAGRVAASLRGFKKVAINCSACLYAMRAQYQAEGVNLSAEIVSLADVLAPAAQNLACPVKPRPVYYHDPCYNARYNNVVEQPRRALAQLAEVRELSWNKSDTECCGGGGLLPKTMPMIADQMAKRRLAEVQATGGGLVVTSCATCTFMLKRNAPPSVEVANLATAMAQLSETPYTAPPSSPLDDEI
jgi:Fe-S oxidoreductase